MRSPNKAAVWAFIVLCLAAFDAALAQAGGQQRERETMDFVLGNVEFLLLHELSHLLISEKKLPIIGPEENAADYLATMALILTEPFDPEHQDQTLDFLLATADAFATSWSLGSALGAEIPYWGTHALSIQRYYQIACLLYGSDPVRFERIPEITRLPASRADACVVEFKRADASIQWLLDSYGRAPDDPAGGHIAILYERPESLVATRILEEIQASRLFELTLERLTDRFVIEQPFSVVMRSCGVSEAAWLAAERELVVCYELLDTLYLLSLPEPPEQLAPVLRAD